MSEPNSPKPARGRPRGFDVDAALEAAMRAFWKHGYEGTSLDDLTDAMGINRPSLYAAFGNKESLFRKVIERYSNTACGRMQAALALPTARETVEQMLRQTLGGDGAANASDPSGCLLVQGALACSAQAEQMRSELVERRDAVRLQLQKRFERAVIEGDLPRDANPAALARYVATVLHGLSIQSSSGATCAERAAVIEIALQAFPATKAKPVRAARKTSAVRKAGR